MIGPEWAAVAPLRVGDFAGSIANGSPTVVSDRLAFALEGFLEPRNHESCLGLGRAVSHVIVGQGEIKRILPRDKLHREKVASGRGVRIIEAAEAPPPIRIPTAGVIRRRIVAMRRFTDPENSRHDM